MNDEQVRARLVQYLTSRGYRPLEEISLAWNRTRIDVVGMKNGVLCGFEIKSEKDTLERLKKQAKRYRRYFEKLYLVGAEGHLEGATQMLPHYWGIWAVRPSSSGVHIVRKAPPARSTRSNKHQKAAPLAAVMRKPELLGDAVGERALIRPRRAEADRAGTHLRGAVQHPGDRASAVRGTACAQAGWPRVDGRATLKWVDGVTEHKAPRSAGPPVGAVRFAPDVRRRRRATAHDGV